MFCGAPVAKQRRKGTHRSANGTGTVVKLGSNRKKPYGARISCVDGGEKKYFYIGYYATRAEAVAALAEQQTNPVTNKARSTFEQLFDDWAKTRAYLDVSQSTKYSYNAAYNHFAPLHQKIFTELRAEDFERCIDTATKIIKNKPVPVSSSTKKHMKVLAGLLTKYALRTDVIRKGYAEYIRLEKSEKAEHKTFSKDEICKLFENDTLLGVDIILILLYTGMRINELLRLKKDDIDLEENIIKGGLKTDAGKGRIIPIHPKIQKYVKKYYDNAENYIFMRTEESRLLASYFRKNYYIPALEKLGIEYKTIHSTRHTFATMLAENGADKVAIKDLSGHANYAYTVDTYTHVNVDFLREQLLKIE
jgi:integrase